MTGNCISAPTNLPSLQPTILPSNSPTILPTLNPTALSAQPSSKSSQQPTGIPSNRPTSEPTKKPSVQYIDKIEVITFAGSGLKASIDGQGISASFNGVIGMTLNTFETGMYITEIGKSTIRYIDIATAIVSNFDFIGMYYVLSIALILFYSFSFVIVDYMNITAPVALTVDNEDNIYFCDGNQIGKIAYNVTSKQHYSQLFAGCKYLSKHILSIQ